MKKKRIFYLILCVGLLMVGLWFGYRYYLLEQKRLAWRSLERSLVREVADFPGEVGLVIRDLSSNWQISLNADASFPAASLVKLPIMLSYYQAAQEKKVDLKETLRFRTSDWVGGSGRLKEIPKGGEFSLAQLIELMISHSDNIATNMLIDELGLDYLNRSFRALGLRNTNLARKMMDFKSRSAGRENYTTPEDISYILENIYRGELISKQDCRQCLELLKGQTANDRIPAKLPLKVSVAHKTGMEKGVCHDVGIVFTEKGDFLICVLTKHNQSNAKLAKGLIAQVALLTYRHYLGR